MPTGILHQEGTDACSREEWIIVGVKSEQADEKRELGLLTG